MNGRPKMWQQYIAFNIDTPLVAAFVQFMLLGTLGELVSKRLRQGERGPALGPTKLALKALGWGFLGIYIKFMFLIASAGALAIHDHDYLPGFVTPNSVAFAFVVSTVMNVFLGPSMMLVHRLWDNTVDRLLDQTPATWAGLQGALATLLWLWIPTHTLTFTQAPELRIGIAAFLSLLLGVVMGVSGRKRVTAGS